MLPRLPAVRVGAVMVNVDKSHMGRGCTHLIQLKMLV
jgi:hypothetical protein